MIRILLLIAMFSIVANAGMYSDDQLNRIANALERIANIMEKEHYMNVNNCIGKREKLPQKQYNVEINGHPLKAVPSSPIFDENELLKCKSECKERFKLFTEIETCIKQYCGE